jgi:hypothetical protein
VNRKVAVTSTLAVFENAPPLQPRFLDALSPTAALNYLAGREKALRSSSCARPAAGCDPTGNGSALAGFGDQQKHFSWPGQSGSVSYLTGKQAEPVDLVEGNPVREIADIESCKVNLFRPQPPAACNR